MRDRNWTKPKVIKGLAAAAAAAFAFCFAAPAHSLVRMSESVYSYSIPNGGFVALGTDSVKSDDGAFLMDTSLGTTKEPKMQGGEWTLGAGIVASGQTATSNLDRAHAFPNPFMPSRSHRAVTFTHLTPKVTIRIYTLAGELVKELTKDSNSTDQSEWYPVNNRQGQPVASGVYLWYIVSSEGQVKTGKLMVIR